MDIAKCPHGYTAEIRFIVCDECIALRKAPKRDADKSGLKCQGCGHVEVNHNYGGKGKGCVVYLEDASGFCPCKQFARRKKKSVIGPGWSPKREPSGTRFCEHGVPGTQDCIVVECWNNREKKPKRPRQKQLQLPLLGLIPLREVIDAAADDIERERTRRRKKAKLKRENPKPKSEPPPLTGRAPRAHDGEEV